MNVEVHRDELAAASGENGVWIHTLSLSNVHVSAGDGACCHLHATSTEIRDWLSCPLLA